MVRRVIEGLGRLSFTMSAVEWYRPFLAPFYAWVSAVPAGTCLTPPVMLRITMQYLEERFEAEPLEIDCVDWETRPYKNAVFTDAMAGEGRAAIGSWEEVPGKALDQIRWFYLELDEHNASWVFEQGKEEAYRVIASLELLGTLVGLELFTRDLAGQRLETWVRFKAVTDNQGNSYAVTRMATTRYPLCCVMMQLAHIARIRRLKLQAQWESRDKNALADRISKGDFTGLNESKRLAVNLEVFDVMKRMLASGRALYDEVSQLRADAKQAKKDMLCSSAMRRTKKRRFESSKWE